MMADVITIVAAGLAISTAFHLLAIPLLPSRIMDGISWWKMSVRKHVLPPTVNMEMVSRAVAADGPAMPVG